MMTDLYISCTLIFVYTECFSPDLCISAYPWMGDKFAVYTLINVICFSLSLSFNNNTARQLYVLSNTADTAAKNANHDTTN